MPLMTSKCFLFALLALPVVHAQFAPLRHYEGSTFFDEWDFYGFVDNTTWGNVTYADRTNATTQNLAYVNPAGHAIIKVDNTTVLQPAELVLRPSVRITTQYAFPIGSLFVLDLDHLPYGCSVWGAFWTLGILPPGLEWPIGGEIDIIEGINRREVNQVALHTTEGCFSDDPAAVQTGRPLERNCTQDAGCTVLETKPNSYGSSFARAGGGVYATQFDLSGIYLWFWSRADIPASIRDSTPTSNMNPSDWGPPTASYPRSRCDIPTYFTAQKLIFTITMCGAWADAPGVFNQTCPGRCIDNVIGTGNPQLNDAYFDIRYLRTYYPQGQEVPDTALPPPENPSDTTSTNSEAPTDTAVGSPSRSPGSGAEGLNGKLEWVLIFSLLAIGASAVMTL